jgi:porin
LSIAPSAAASSICPPSLRGGAGVNKWVGTSNQFAPSTFQGGRLWRFQQVYLTYTTPELFGVKEFLTLSGGWQNPTDIFIK